MHSREIGPQSGGENRAEELGYAIYKGEGFEKLADINDEDMYEGFKRLMGEMSSEHTRTQLKHGIEKLKSESAPSADKQRVLSSWERYEQSQKDTE